MAGRAWTARDLFELRTRYPLGEAEVIAQEQGRSVAAVHTRAYKLGICRYRRWTDDERALLKDRAGKESYRALARRLGRTYRSVKHEVLRLGLGGDWPRTEWTPARVAFLREHFSTMTAAQIGTALGVTEKAVVDKKHRLGLRRTRGMTPEAEAVLWELRDVEGVVEHVATSFHVSSRAVRRRLDQLVDQGGPLKPVGSPPPVKRSTQPQEEQDA